ncbi:MAG: hypothetical protein A2527_14720 [Candidatus Lambdaproteobacteria bacterium RIFOXYD2_FULL_50_16]|uniref:Uncharacterized protein n=1 Tax=Candidatus Lambdaproteobacteria bacterium RIFOXYD2_FULL_50_16 TaxID=1817772 RepID=A0A1F6G5N6_9PROT|nr:MAG: hypothetical protein A2527_14720 [Candidatus Lambdaproteobacteria bacterium RIFOXYD2_FULL_50_16]
MLDFKTIDLANNPNAVVHTWEEALEKTQEPNLRIAHKGKEFPFGAEVLMIQMIGRWVSQQKHQSFHTFIQPPQTGVIEDYSTVQLKKIIASDWGYILLSLLRNQEGYIRRTDNSIINWNEVESIIREKYEQFQAPIKRGEQGQIKGRCASLICVEPTQSRLDHFYFDDGSLRPESEFRNVLEKIYAESFRMKASNVSDQNLHRRNEMLEDTAAVLYELFENTDKWGNKNFQGEISEGTRGVQFKDQIFSGGSEGPLKTFATSMKTNKYIQLSVFDTGLGLVQHWKKKPIAELSIQEEHQACLECFTRDFQMGDKKGLKRLREVIDKRKGFFQLRTGRLFLYYIGGERSANNQIILKDFFSQTEAPTQLPISSGTSYTILIPID